MISEVFEKKSLFWELYALDKLTAERYQEKPCPYCGGPLHFANYLRKPRGELCDLPEKYFIRFSLCCGAPVCRRRVTPHSCRFLDRKVYWFPVIVCVASERQRLPPKFNKLKFPEDLTISHNTLDRWSLYFQDDFPSSPQWQRIRGLASPSVKNNNLPLSLFNAFSMSNKFNFKKALISCLKFLCQGWALPLRIRAG